MSGIFLSYRREDSAGHAGRLFDRLSARFGTDHVFIDVDTIKPGQDFAKIIDERIGNCDVLVVLIGKEWLQIATPTGQQRLDDPEDFVRLEVVSALNAGLVVIPVLVEGACMPLANSLPGALKRLSRLQALTLSDAHFQQDADNLVDAIERYTVSPLTPTLTGNPKRRQLGAIAASLFGVGVLLGLLWVNNPDPLQHSPARAANLSGRWVAQVPLRNGGHYAILLRLETLDNRILGSVQFPAGSGGVQEGRMERDRIFFSTVHRPQFSEREVTTRFEGQVIGEELELVMQYDDVVQRFRARRKS